MKKIDFFAALCCATLLLAACEKDKEKVGFLVATGNETGHDYVDLGLSVRWATCNVGAEKPEEYGNYYAWGETATKTTYSWGTYAYGSADNVLTKYNTDSHYGTVDKKTTLETINDAATKNWGGSWRMPTSAEWEELRTSCTWTLATLNGVAGYKVIGKNKNAIFLPTAGYRSYNERYGVGSKGHYWSSSCSTNYPNRAWNIFFDSNYVGRNDSGRRYFGQSVRPVCK